MATSKIGTVGKFKQVNKEGGFLAFLPMTERVNPDSKQATRERIVLDAWQAAMGTKNNGVAFVDSNHPLNGFTQRDVRVATSMVLWLLQPEGGEFLKRIDRTANAGAPHWGSRIREAAAGLNQKIVPAFYVPNAQDQNVIEFMAGWLESRQGAAFVSHVNKTLGETGSVIGKPLSL